MTQNDILLEPSPRGWPGTVRYRLPRAGGARFPAYRIVPVYLSPLGAWVRAVLTLVWLGAVIYAATQADVIAGRAGVPWLAWWHVLAAGLVLTWPVRWILALVLAGASVVEIEPGLVRVLGPFGWRSYQRDMGVRFELHWHRKARAASLRGESAGRHAREGFHVVLRHCGEAKILATVHGEWRARALLDRLNACLALSGEDRESAALLSPERQYAESDGAL